MAVISSKNSRIKTHEAARRFVAQKYLSQLHETGTDGLNLFERRAYAQLYSQQRSSMTKHNIKAALETLEPVVLKPYTDELHR